MWCTFSAASVPPSGMVFAGVGQSVGPTGGIVLVPNNPRMDLAIAKCLVFQMWAVDTSEDLFVSVGVFAVVSWSHTYAMFVWMGVVCVGGGVGLGHHWWGSGGSLPCILLFGMIDRAWGGCLVKQVRNCRFGVCGCRI